jgi:hypothetical protein
LMVKPCFLPWIKIIIVDNFHSMDLGWFFWDTRFDFHTKLGSSIPRSGSDIIVWSVKIVVANHTDSYSIDIESQCLVRCSTLSLLVAYNLTVPNLPTTGKVRYHTWELQMYGSFSRFRS